MGSDEWEGTVPKTSAGLSFSAFGLDSALGFRGEERTGILLEELATPIPSPMDLPGVLLLELDAAAPVRLDGLERGELLLEEGWLPLPP